MLSCGNLVDVNHVEFPMETIKDNVIQHSKYKIYVYGGARTVSGLDGNGILLNGVNQYMDISKAALCNGDLEHCPKGFTFRIKVFPNTLKDNTYFVSSAPLDVYYRNGQLVSEVRSQNKRWRASAAALDRGSWHTIDVSWHPMDGLSMYVDSKRVAVQPRASDNWDGYDPEQRFFIGRADTSMLRERYPNAIIDDVEIWEAKRDYLIGQGLITRGKSRDDLLYVTPVPLTAVFLLPKISVLRWASWRPVNVPFFSRRKHLCVYTA